MSIILGTHITSDLDEILDVATYSVKQLGMTCIQFFVNANVSKTQRRIYTNLRKICKKCIPIVHVSYTINCALDWDQYSWWIIQCIEEIKLAAYVGATMCVIHIGKQLELATEQSINNIYTSLLHIHSQTVNSNVKIVLETASGAGTEIGAKLEDLSKIYTKFRDSRSSHIRARFGICIDTCHIYAAGYDIATKSGLDTYLKKFDGLIGIDNIMLVHLNDCKSARGSRIDRHANFGYGNIGSDAIMRITKMFKRVPIVLETPAKHLIEDYEFVRDHVH